MKPTYNTKMGKESGGHASRRALGGAVLFLLFVLSVPFQPVYAQSSSGSQVYLAGSENSALNRRMITLLREALGSTVNIRSFSSGQTSQDKTTPVITLGPEAFTRVRQENRDVPILALLVDQSFISGYAGRSEGSVSGILYNPPLIR